MIVNHRSFDDFFLRDKVQKVKEGWLKEASHECDYLEMKIVFIAKFSLNFFLFELLFLKFRYLLDEIFYDREINFSLHCAERKSFLLPSLFLSNQEA